MGILDSLRGLFAGPNGGRSAQSGDQHGPAPDRSSGDDGGRYSTPAGAYGDPSPDRGSGSPDVTGAQGDLTAEQARDVERYEYLLRTAPPEQVEQAHQEAFAKLDSQQRQELQRRLGEASGEPVPDDRPETLARSATRHEMQQPGGMRSLLGAGGLAGAGIGAVLLTSVAGAFMGTAIAGAMFDESGLGADGGTNGGDTGGGAEDGTLEVGGQDEGADGGMFGGDGGGFGDFGDLGF